MTDMRERPTQPAPGDGTPGPKPPYQEPTGMAGITAGEVLHGLILVVAAGADVAAFYQVLSLVLRELPDLLILIAVAGFTACALGLAHFAGVLYRDVKEGHGSVGHLHAWLAVSGWTALGLVAFVVRLVESQGAPGASVAVSTGSGQSLNAALLFLGLYIASGLVAGLGAFVTRQPVRARYRRALKDFRRARRRMTRSQTRYERALTVLQIHLRNRDREGTNFQYARDFREAITEEMRCYAALLIAQHLQDPAATSGLTKRRRHPSLPRPEEDTGPLSPNL